MLKSMTGYGRGSSQHEGLQIIAEIRTVNHRFAEVVVRAPKEWLLFEDLIKKLVTSYVARGRAEVSLTISQNTSSKKVVTVDELFALQVHQAMTRLAAQLNQRMESFFEQILQFPGVLQVADAGIDEQVIRDVLTDAVQQACSALVAMRMQEGQTIANDLLGRLSDVEKMVADIKQHAPAVVSAYRERLRQRMQEFLQLDSMDEQRLATEIVLFADKSDISEELVRLHSHIQQFRYILDESEPIGRKLDFLLQEMNREINTIGAKANDAKIAGIVVECKTRLEQLREQIQNIE